MTLPKFSLVAAVDQQFGLGKNNTLPWRLPSDLKHFSEITTTVVDSKKRNAVIMGRRTWESLPSKSRPLKGRVNVILSRSLEGDLPPETFIAGSLDEALQKLQEDPQLENIFVIGGGKVFEEAMKHQNCEKIYLTQIHASFDCDAFFPLIDTQKYALESQGPLKQENNLEFQFLVYKNTQCTKN